MRGRRFTLFAIVILLLAAAQWVVWGMSKGAMRRLDRQPLPAFNAFVGKTEAEVRAILGSPTRESAGHYGMPSSDFVQQFPGRVKTLVFLRSGVEHYVSFEERPEGWIGICSQSVEEGAVF